MYAVALGEMFDGITFHGPFQEFDDAEKWAGGKIRDTNWWIVELEPAEKSCGTLVIGNVDMETLQEQYVRLQEVITFVENMRTEFPAIPDASILDGIVEMLGDVLPLIPDTRFRVGQRVRVLRGEHVGPGTVLKVIDNRVPYLVSVDADTDEYSKTHGRCYSDSWLEEMDDTPCVHEWNWYANESTGGRKVWYCLKCGKNRDE
jgi:hypothetical protein